METRSARLRLRCARLLPLSESAALNEAEPRGSAVPGGRGNGKLQFTLPPCADTRPVCRARLLPRGRGDENTGAHLPFELLTVGPFDGFTAGRVGRSGIVVATGQDR